MTFPSRPSMASSASGGEGVPQFHKGETGRIPGDTHSEQGPVVTEGPFQLVFAGTSAQVKHIHFPFFSVVQHDVRHTT